MEAGAFQNAEKERSFYEKTERAGECVSIECAVPEGSVESVERL